MSVTPANMGTQALDAAHQQPQPTIEQDERNRERDDRDNEQHEKRFEHV